MALIVRQITATTGSPALLGTIPPGECCVVITNAGNADVMIGGANVSIGTGGIVPTNGTITFYTFPSSRGSDVYAIVNTGGSSTLVSMLISTAS